MENRTIRPARPEDASRLAEILIFAKRMAYRPIFRNDHVSFNVMQVLPLALHYRDEADALRDVFVYDDGIVKGMMSWGRAEEAQGRRELCELYIDPCFQREGVGAALISDFAAHATADGLTTATLWVLEENPQAILIAECWDDSREWCTVGDMFDGTMHYVLSSAIWKFFAEERWSLAQFDAGINRAMMLYPQEVQNVMWSFLSSHDTERMLTRCGNRARSMRAAAFFQMTYPGVPVIYYGDELGMRGGPDPDCRRSMTWERVPTSGMLAYYKRLTHMRNSLPVLREGTWITHEVGRDGLYAYLRRTDDATALCVLNTSAVRIRRTLALPQTLAEAGALLDALSGKRLAVQSGAVMLSLAPGAGRVLIR